MAIHFVADVHVANHRRFSGEVISGVNARAREVLDVLKRATYAIHLNLPLRYYAR